MKKKTNAVTLPREQKDKAVQELKAYIEDHFEIESGNLQAELLLAFLGENTGLLYYNMGVTDAISFMADKVDDLYLLMKE